MRRPVPTRLQDGRTPWQKHESQMYILLNLLNSRLRRAELFEGSLTGCAWLSNNQVELSIMRR